MNIILGESARTQLGDAYTVLKLDRVTIGSSTPVQAYCVVDIIPVDELPKTEGFKKLHDSLLEEYYKRNWSFCEDAIEHLIGAWNGTIDSFYTDLLSRINTYKLNPPADSWTGVIAK